MIRSHAAARSSPVSDGPPEIAAAIDEEIDREPRYQPVAQDGAARAAGAISELL